MGRLPNIDFVRAMCRQMTDDNETCVRLRKRAQFLFARKGPSERRKSLVIQAVKRLGDPASSHVGDGYTATKKVGNAVCRNRARRRLKAAAHLLLPQTGVAGCDYVFIARNDTADIAWPRLLDDMESALISLAAQLQVNSQPRQ